MPYGLNKLSIILSGPLLKGPFFYGAFAILGPEPVDEKRLMNVRKPAVKQKFCAKRNHEGFRSRIFLEAGKMVPYGKKMSVNFLEMSILLI